MGGGQVEDLKLLLDAGWHTAALIKLRGKSTIMCPCFATSSWDAIASINNNTVTFGMLDDVPRQLRTSSSVTVDLSDLNWANENWERALELRNADHSRRFGLAFNVSYSWNQTADRRVALANLWCGIEALFGDSSDKPVTDKLVARICSWLGIQDHKTVRDLYDRRCDAVHGRWLEDELADTLAASERILRDTLVKCIDTNSAPLADWGK